MDMSRRQFMGTVGAGMLTGAVFANAAVASVALAESGSASGSGSAAVSTLPQSSFATAPAVVDESKITQTYEADVLVVGAGVAGMSAARAAAEAGAKVIVVEKATGPVCRGNFGCQFGAIDSSYQQQYGITIDKVSLVERFQRDTMQGSNQFFVQYWADHSGETLDWCLAACDAVQMFDLGGRDGFADLPDGTVGIVGVEDDPASDVLTDRYPAYNTKIIIGSNDMGLNTGGFTLMLQNFQKVTEAAGGQYLFSTFGRYLEKDGDTVTGLIAQTQSGDYIRVTAKVTILACGDFANDMEMREYYAPQCAQLMCLYNGMDCDGNVSNTGDGHKMAMWAGAHMEPAPYAPMSHLSQVNDVLIVNRKGERIGNEDLGAQSITDAILRQPGKQVFVISGNSQGSIVLDPGPMGVATTDTYDDFTKMAAAIGEYCDAQVLQQTVEGYNTMCAAGEDTQYGKAAKYMLALDAPYYATPCAPGNLLVIMGGIAVSDACQALDENDVEIPGLYIVGNNQGGRFGAEYPMTAPGISHGIAFTLGRYAGTNAAAAVK